MASVSGIAQYISKVANDPAVVHRERSPWLQMRDRERAGKWERTGEPGIEKPDSEVANATINNPDIKEAGSLFGNTAKDINDLAQSYAIGNSDANAQWNQGNKDDNEGGDQTNDPQYSSYNPWTTVGDNGVLLDNTAVMPPSQQQGGNGQDDGKTGIDKYNEMYNNEDVMTEAEEAKKAIDEYEEATRQWLMNHAPEYNNAVHLMSEAPEELIAEYISSPEVGKWYGGVDYDTALAYALAKRAEGTSITDAVSDPSKIGVIGIGKNNIQNAIKYVLSLRNPDTGEPLLADKQLFQIANTAKTDEDYQDMLENSMGYEMLGDQIRYMYDKLGISGPRAFDYFSADDINELAVMDNMRFGERYGANGKDFYSLADEGKAQYQELPVDMSYNAFETYGVPATHLSDSLERTYGGTLGFTLKGEDEKYLVSGLPSYSQNQVQA